MATIRKRKWKTPKGEVRSAWVVDYTDNRGCRRRKQFLSKKAADRFRVEIEGQIAKGTYRPDAEKVTVKEICESFLEHCAGRMKRNERMTRKTHVVYRGHINNHLLSPEYGLGGNKLSQFTAKSVGDFRDRLREGGATVPTTRKVLATLHAVLEFAISQDLVAVNAAHGVKVIGPRDEGSRKITPPSKDDLKKLIEAASEDFSLILLFAASTGVRAGEQWALRWADVDVEAGEFRVECRIDSYGVEGPPKSAAGVRTVPLSGHLCAELKRWRLRSKFSKSEDFVFPNSQGNHTCHDNLIKRQFNILFEKLKEAHEEDPGNSPEPPARFNWHALRHYAVSTWIEAGLTLKTVQTFAGHSSLQVTMDRYGHLFPSGDHRRAMDQIAGELLG